MKLKLTLIGFIVVIILFKVISNIEIDFKKDEELIIKDTEPVKEVVEEKIVSSEVEQYNYNYEPQEIREYQVYLDGDTDYTKIVNEHVKEIMSDDDDLKNYEIGSDNCNSVFKELDERGFYVFNYDSQKSFEATYCDWDKIRKSGIYNESTVSVVTEYSKVNDLYLHCEYYANERFEEYNYYAPSCYFKDFNHKSVFRTVKDEIGLIDYEIYGISYNGKINDSNKIMDFTSDNNRLPNKQEMIEMNFEAYDVDKLNQNFEIAVENGAFNNTLSKQNK